MKRKFFVCSVGEPGEDYTEKNYNRCIDNNGHFMNQDTTQKGCFYSVNTNDIVFLKYNKKLRAYGIVTKRDDSENEDLKDWNLAIYVKEWIFHNKEKEGVSYYGINDATIDGNSYSTIKEITSEFAIEKMSKINNKNDLFKEIQNEFYKEGFMEDIKELLIANKNLILHGAPGTGKTYLAKQIAKELGCSDKEMEMVQFHPSFDYTDFIEGLRPCSKKENGDIDFERADGIFKKFCKKALACSDSDKKFVFIIDEINRGEISKIFGELFYSIEPDYRGPKGRIDTQYQNLVEKGDEFEDGFYIPENVYIIGTMNDIDRSVDSMDFAFRRRFSFKEIKAKTTQSAILNNTKNKEEAIERMDNLNRAIWDEYENSGIEGLSTDYHIGAAYFKKLDSLDGNFQKLWDLYLKGLLKEYLRGMENSVESLQLLKDAYNLENMPQD